MSLEGDIVEKFVTYIWLLTVLQRYHDERAQCLIPQLHTHGRISALHNDSLETTTTIYMAKNVSHLNNAQALNVFEKI